MTDEGKIEELQQHMKMVVEALMALSEANGCALDSLLALLPALGTAGLLDKTFGGTALLQEALKGQHSQLHKLNGVIAKLIQDLGMDDVAGNLNPSPEPSSQMP